MQQPWGLLLLDGCCLGLLAGQQTAASELGDGDTFCSGTGQGRPAPRAEITRSLLVEIDRLGAAQSPQVLLGSSHRA